jgi:hypothetical protein
LNMAHSSVVDVDCLPTMIVLASGGSVGGV